MQLLKSSWVTLGSALSIGWAACDPLHPEGVVIPVLDGDGGQDAAAEAAPADAMWDSDGGNTTCEQPGASEPNDASLTCPGDSKACDGQCVSTNDPEHGCGNLASCQPCVSPPGRASCVNGQCVLSDCQVDFADCDGNPSNGCETSTAYDAKNCGACARDCEGGFCKGGACTPVTFVPKQSGVLAIAMDDTAVYWTSHTTLMKANKAGGPPVTLATGLVEPGPPVVDATDVFWAKSVKPGAVMRVSKQGGVPVVITDGQSFPSGVALDDDYVYWTNWTECGSVMKVAKTGGVAVELVSGQATPDAIAVLSDQVYWTTHGFNGAIRKVPKTGGTPVTLAEGQPFPRNLAVDPSGVYWTNQLNDGGTVRKVGLEGGTPITLALNQSGPFGIALDAVHVYWVTTSGDVSRVPKLGGSSFAVGSWSYGLSGIVVDTAHAYLTHADRILRVPK